MLNTPYQPISCRLYDYLEIACLRSYPLEIILTDGSQITAEALNLHIKEKQEWLIVNTNNLTSQSTIIKQRIRLDTIKSILLLQEDTEFKKIDFQEI